MATTLFALDIGTRSVVGIILKEKKGIYHVADIVSIEHKERSMIDGQIHNVLSVADVILEIKKILEVKHGPLEKVSVAAAGRALITSEGSMAIDISETPLVSVEDINKLELAAVQQGQQKLLSSNSISKDEYYYCVGYSVLYYKLDGEKIGSLIDQAGLTASVEVIATFLPRVVVESLLASLKRAGLEMEALTLEPIAAINVLIPPSMRRLNVAIVDVGAGTSDIAISDNNTVVGFGMVPIAGDKITEALSHHFLLDFPLAENAKRRILEEEAITITDILGFDQNFTSSDLSEFLSPTVEHLAKSISDEIKRLNCGKSPKAVMMVGGGSLTPGLTQEISKCLGLTEDRVKIRGLDALNGVTVEPDIRSTPEFVTPIGIAIAARRAPIHYISIMINDKMVRLFELKEMTVGDVLLAANVPASQLYGNPGLGLTITLNDKETLVPGENGTPSMILLNKQQASTKDSITSGDSIQLLPGKNGKDASATVRDLLEEPVVLASVDGIEVQLEPEVIINGDVQTINTQVQDQDIINVTYAMTLTDVLAKIHRSDLLKENAYSLVINRESVTLKKRISNFSVKNTFIEPSYIIKNGDQVIAHSQSSLTVNEVLSTLGKRGFDEISVTFNKSPVTIRKPRLSITLNKMPVGGKETIKSGDTLDFISLGEDPITFGDIFAYSDYILPKKSSNDYQLFRNGSEIGFNDPIFSEDTLEIIFL